MECVPAEQLDPKAVADGLAETNRRMAAAGQASELEKAEIAIHHEVYQAMNNAITKK